MCRNHGFTRTKAIMAERRKAAEERNEDYNLLTLEEKLASLPVGGAKKQRARLEKQLADRKLAERQ